MESATGNIDILTREFVERHGMDCSNRPLSLRQRLFYIGLFVALMWLLLWRWDWYLFVIATFFSLLYLGSACFRGSAALASLLGKGERKVSAARLDELDDESLPVYTILLPLYREANIASRIVRNIGRLDYPPGKLDVKLLLESDDNETLGALESCVLPPGFEIIRVPLDGPRTKPRACNYGLAAARGEFCVIYDAEDRPEPDQLRKSLCVFADSPPDLACVQAKLNYYNARQNLLTRLFTIEYSTTFDLILAGLSTFKTPLPLGGTSNHFRTSVLRDIGGWDPFNVTEDCDLGIRIYKRNYRTALMDSTTWEEANSEWWNWIRQRSRWVKGFIQTHFTHMRHPLRTFRGLGLRGMFGFYMSVGASSFMMLANVFYWLVGGVYLFLLGHGLKAGIPLYDLIAGPHAFRDYQGLRLCGFQLKAWPLFYAGAGEDVFLSRASQVFFVIGVVLLLANLMFVLCNVLACVRRRQSWLLPYCLLMPFYWVMISVGAWKGFLQFFTSPFYWEKTLHGLDGREDQASGSPGLDPVTETIREADI